MPYSKASYTGDGTTANFSVPFPYLDKADVSALVNGSTASFTWASSSVVTISPAPANGAAVQVIRTTPRTALVTWATPTTIKSVDLNKSATELLYLIQEGLDNATDGLRPAFDGMWDALSHRIKNVSTPTAANDAATKNYVDSTISSGVTSLISALASAAAGSILTIRNAASSLLAINIYSESGETNVYAKDILRTQHAAGHADQMVVSRHIEVRPAGSGKNGPASSDLAYQVSAVKQGFASGSALNGEMDAVSINVRQDGPDTGEGSDSSCLLINGYTATLNGFLSGVEGRIGTMLRGPTFAAQKEVGFQMGSLNNVAGTVHGLVLLANLGTIDTGLNIATSSGTFTNPIIYSTAGTTRFRVNNVGTISLYETSVPLDTTRLDISNLSGGFSVKRQDGVTIFSVSSAGVGLIAGDTTISGEANAASMQTRPRSAPPSPAPGIMYFDSDTSKLMVCEDGTNWKTMTTS